MIWCKSDSMRSLNTKLLKRNCSLKNPRSNMTDHLHISEPAPVEGGG